MTMHEDEEAMAQWQRLIPDVTAVPNCKAGKSRELRAEPQCDCGTCADCDRRYCERFISDAMRKHSR